MGSSADAKAASAARAVADAQSRADSSSERDVAKLEAGQETALRQLRDRLDGDVKALGSHATADFKVKG